MSQHSEELPVVNIPDSEYENANITYNDVGGKLLTESFDSLELQEACKKDPDLLAGIAMPDVFTYMWPPVFQYVWSWLTDKIGLVRDFSRLALGLPRGFGKSTLVKLFILYVILYTRRKYIIVICATEKLAEAIISDVMDMLEEPNIRGIFGDWRVGKITDTQNEKVFAFRGRNIILRGIGVGGSIRGSNKKNARPDLMVFDDVQSREDADSEVISTKLYNWLIGTAMKAKDPRGCMTLFIANMYPTPHSILKKLKANKYWEKVIAGGILITPEGELASLWEELQPLKQLLQEYEADKESGRAEIFAAEVLNDEDAALNTLVDLTKLPKYPIPEGEIATGSFIVIDPATDKPGADDVSIGYFEVFDIKPSLEELITGSISPSDTVKYALETAIRRNCPLIVVEANAYQHSLLHWFDYFITQLGIQGISVVPIYSGKNSKNSRILEMFKSYVNGDIYVNPRCKSAVDAQVNSFNPLKRDNTDGILDLLTYAPRVIIEYGHAIQIQTLDNMISSYEDGPEVLESTGSPF